MSEGGSSSRIGVKKKKPQHGSGLSDEALGPLVRIEATLKMALDARTFEGDLGAAVRHALLGGGKRIRPLLAWHASVASGGTGEDALPACVAVEMVHAFSLVHDDLPALDDDDLRRGKPTVHVAFGEACAILAGDALLSLAHQTLSESELDGERRGACARVLSRATLAMINGQVLDMQRDCGPATAQNVRRVHEAKTGALISAACEMGGICAGASGKVLESLAAFGLELGLLFQATDDLIDVEQASEHAGKRTGKDRDAGKRTLPGVLGVDGARAEVGRLHRECEAALVSLGDRGDERTRVLGEIAAAIARRTR